MTQKDRNTDPVGRGRIYNSITETIGNTPIVSLSRMAAEHAVEANLLAKLEFFNPIASVKDRIGVAMIEALESENRLAATASLSSRPPAIQALRWPLRVPQKAIGLSYACPKACRWNGEKCCCCWALNWN